MTPKGVKKIDPVKDNDKIKDLEKNKIDNKKKAFTTFKVDTLKVGIYSDDDDDFDFKSLVKKVEDKKAKAEIIQANLNETKDG